MANALPFSKNKKKIVCEDGTVTWTNQLVTQSPLVFSNTEDSLNETYATAVDVNETHYLSVLESDDETLQEINNLTLSNDKMMVNNDISLNIGVDNNFDSADSEQVVIFNVEGSEELYGIQVAHDEDGNVHRYQFQFRKTENGQLEAMPETIQLLTNENDPTLAEEHSEKFPDDQVNEETFEHPVLLQEALEHTNEDSQDQLIIPEQGNEILEKHSDVDGNVYDNEESDVASTDNPVIYMKTENICNEMTYEDEEELNQHFDNTYNGEIIEVKPGPGLIKQEIMHNQNEPFVGENEESQLENSEEAVSNEGYSSEADSYRTIETQNDGEETIISYQHYEPQHIEEHYENSNESNLQQEATHFLVDENNLDQLNYNIELQQHEEDEDSGNILIVEKNPSTNDSENEDFEIVEGLPVTAEGEISEDTSSTLYQETEILYSEPDVSLPTFSPKDKSPKTLNILKQPTNTNKINNDTKKTILYYMVPNTDQKENLKSIPLNVKNPRSVLKTNIEMYKMKEEHIKTFQREKLLEKRYARSKEVIQAKMFNNFINKTTIPHAPIRQGRTPRKQEIKPVNTRTNEEIIVQEVMVSSKGFVENLNDRLKNLDKLEVTSIVELSDSDEDYDPKNNMEKKKKHKKIQPTNPETSDSEASVIEIHSDEESTVADNSTKRNRGRPKKDSNDSLKRSRGKGYKSSSSDESSPQKKSRSEESSEVESDSGKKEISCPHCSKTFPNQNSLSTHIQHHNLEKSLRNIKKPAVEYKHKCEDCQQTFKNSILLKRHDCSSKNTRPTYKCAVCPKTFRDVTVFNIHKKSHAKENLIKSTSQVTVSPKKFTPSTSSRRLVNNYKCKECSKVCSSQSILSTHEKTHKKFICARCNESFNSKLLLDMHVRTKCVKSPLPKDKRLSFKIRRSFVNTSRGGRSINPVKALIRNSPFKKSFLPTATDRKTFNVAPKRSINPISSNIKPAPKKSINLKPNNSLNAISKQTSKSVNNFASTSTENMKANRSVLETSNVPGMNVNQGLNNTSMIRPLDVDAQCDSCSMTFSSLTALFKHKVKTHGLSTSDKRVLEPKKKLLHKPLNLHGGIPANQCLNKAFQEMRKKLMLASTDFLNDAKQTDDSVGTNLSDKTELPTIIISESTQSEQ